MGTHFHICGVEGPVSRESAAHCVHEPLGHLGEADEKQKLACAILQMPWRRSGGSRGVNERKVSARPRELGNDDRRVFT